MQSDRLSDFDPAQVKSDAVDAVGSLILVYRHFHGFRSVPIVMLHYLCVGAVHAVARLTPTDMKWPRVLESCVLGLWNLAIGWGRLGKAFLKIITGLLKAKKVDSELITPKTTAIIERLDGAYWTATDVASLAADYVVHSIPPGLSPAGSFTGSKYAAQSVDSLIKATHNFSI